MPVEKFIPEIAEKSTVVVPISMGSDLTGDKLQTLLETLKAKGCDITVLIADTLQKYNVGYAAALAMGNQYLNENKAILQDVKVLRWDKYIASKQPLFERYKQLIESKASTGNSFDTKMRRTQKKCKISQNVESSLEYQKEEYALVLTMLEFDYLIYPKLITVGMACLYSQEFTEFANIKKPQYSQVIFANEKQAKHIGNYGLFNPVQDHKNIILHPMLRIAYDYITNILESVEIASTAKQLLRKKLHTLIHSETVVHQETKIKDSPSSFVLQPTYDLIVALMDMPEISPEAKQLFKERLNALFLITEKDQTPTPSFSGQSSAQKVNTVQNHFYYSN